MSERSGFIRRLGASSGLIGARASLWPAGVWVLVLLLLIAALGSLRFVNLGAKVYWHDEAYSSLRVFGHTGPEFYAGLFDGKVHALADVRDYQQASPGRGLDATFAALLSRPEHPPLYYLLARLWSGWFDDPVVALRSLSALFGLLLLPAVYWLGRELFGDACVSWAAVALAAASPVYLLYAQEARQYSLWLTLTALSSAALLYALRSGARRALNIYALTAALGLYAHLMHAFILAAHALYLGLVRGDTMRARRRSAAMALGIAVLMFVPWLAVLLNAIPDVASATGWMGMPVYASVRVQAWFMNLNRLLFDFPGSGYLAPVSTALSAAAVYTVWRSAPLRARWMLLPMLVIAGGAVILPDLLDGGRRSLEARYLLPALLMLHVCIAYLIGKGIGTRMPLRGVQGRAMGMIGLLVVAGGVYSQMQIVSAGTWWNKSFSARNGEIAAVVNAAERPLLICGLGEVNPGELLSLSHLLEDRVELLLIGPGSPGTLPAGYSHYFVLNPAWDQLRWLDADYTTRQIATDLGIWELISRSVRR